MKSNYAFFILALFVLQCTPKKEVLVSYKDFDQKTKILKNTLNKLIKIRPIEKQHKMALTLQQSRAIKCNEIKPICDKFGHIVSLVIQHSKNKKLDVHEYEKMNTTLMQFHQSIVDYKNQHYKNN